MIEKERTIIYGKKPLEGKCKYCGKRFKPYTGRTGKWYYKKICKECKSYMTSERFKKRDEKVEKMRTVWNEEFKCQVQVSETPLEALDSLQTFFEEDMWYAKDVEWKKEEDMIKYLKRHFEICRRNLTIEDSKRKIEQNEGD